MIGRKIYYGLITGDVLLEVPEKHPINSINTTKEQDFLMYNALQGINPEQVRVIQLEYGQYNADFQSANSVRVDLETGDLLFEYPRFDPPLIVQLEQVKAENVQLKLGMEQQAAIIDAMLGVTN